MWNECQRFWEYLRPAFSRQATYRWFVIAFAGLVMREDTLGVTSIIRALTLTPASYLCLLHFFHSTAWSVEELMPRWWQWLAQKPLALRVNGRLVLTGDHTKTPKDGRKIPAVTTLHQDSESSSKPSFFRGHHWGCLGLVLEAGRRFVSTPLWASIHEGLTGLTADASIPKTRRIVIMAQQVAHVFSQPAYLLLDAYFAAGSVLTTARAVLLHGEPLIHPLARAKKTTVAFFPPPKKSHRGRGRPKKYGRKIRLFNLFDSQARDRTFSSASAQVYDRVETVRYRALNLLWKPVQDLVRFILIESPRGRIVLITTDLQLDPLIALQLYCRRATIETLFSALKNTLGGFAYHFWSSCLAPASRRPRKNTPVATSSNPASTRLTLAAIEKFVNLQLLVLGLLHVLAILYPQEVLLRARCWLRTVSSPIPSEFVTRLALVNCFRQFIASYPKNPFIAFIRAKQAPPASSAKAGEKYL